MQGRNVTTYRIGLAAVLLLLAAILTATVMMTALAADETDDSKIHVVTVDVNPDENGNKNGTVYWYSEKNPNKQMQSGEKCANEEIIHVVAVPNTGYKLVKFVRREDNKSFTTFNNNDLECEPVTKNVTYVAYFERKTYTIAELTTEPKGVSYGTDNGEEIQVGQTFRYGDRVVLPTPQIDTYEFRKWILNDTIELPDNILPTSVDYPNGIKLTAVFVPKKYTVTVIDIEVGTDELIGSRTTFPWSYNEMVKVDGSMELPVDLPEREGYTYSSATEGRQVKVSENDNIFYRWFTPKNYTVRLDNKRGDTAAIGGLDSLTVDFNRPFADLNPADLPTIAGYDFRGYFDKPNGAGKQYIGADGKPFAENEKAVRWDKPSGSETLYAFWTPQSIRVGFSADLIAHATVTVRQGNNSDVYDGTPLAFAYGTEITVTIETKTGYKLVSWNGNAVAHTAKAEFTYTIPVENQTLTGLALPICEAPEFRVDYTQETLTADGSGSFELSFDNGTIPFSGGEKVSLGQLFGKEIKVRRLGDGISTSHSEWVSFWLAARPAAPTATEEGGKVKAPTVGETSISFELTDADEVVYEFAFRRFDTEDLIWQDACDLTNLNAGTKYTFFIRVKATENTPHGEEYSVPLTTLNENYLKGKTEELRGRIRKDDGQNVRDLIQSYIAKMEALPTGPEYQNKMEALIAECDERLPLARYKDQQIAGIEARSEELRNGSLYNDAGKETLESLRAAAVADICDAASRSGVDTAVEAFGTEIAKIPVRIDLTWLFVTLGTVILFQTIALFILLRRHAKYADRVKYVRDGKTVYGFAPLPVLALTARFLPEKSALVALLLGVVALVLQIVLVVLIFRTAAIAKKGHAHGTAEKNDGNNDGGADRYAQTAQAGAEEKPSETEPTADAFAYRPQVSVFRDDDAPSFESDNSAEGLQEEDWYDENFEDDSSADTYESDDGKQ